MSAVVVSRLSIICKGFDHDEREIANLSVTVAGYAKNIAKALKPCLPFAVSVTSTSTATDQHHSKQLIFNLRERTTQTEHRAQILFSILPSSLYHT